MAKQVYYGEFAHLAAWQVVVYPLGLLITIGGLYIMTLKAKDKRK